MGQFADECEILALAVRQLFEHYCRAPERGVFFLSVRHADSSRCMDPPEKLLQLLADGPHVIRAASRARPVEGYERRGLPPTHRDGETGEAGYMMHARVGRWCRPGPVPVVASIHFGGLADRGIYGDAIRWIGEWTLESVGTFLS